MFSLVMELTTIYHAQYELSRRSSAAASRPVITLEALCHFVIHKHSAPHLTAVR